MSLSKEELEAENQNQLTVECIDFLLKRNSLEKKDLREEQKDALEQEIREQIDILSDTSYYILYCTSSHVDINEEIALKNKALQSLSRYFKNKKILTSS